MSRLRPPAKDPRPLSDRVKGAVPLYRGATRSDLDTASQRAIIQRRGEPKGFGIETGN